MCAVAVLSHSLVAGLPWAAAFALGAIVAPTDPLAATEILRRVGAPRRITTVLEGESLVNDATALIAFRIAVSVAAGAGFSVGGAVVDFAVAVVGGIAVGALAARAIAFVRRHIDDVPVEVTIALLSGYVAYVAAEQIHVSGVLAAVTAGVLLAHWAPGFASADMRLTGYAVANLTIFLLNAVLFVLVGLQLPGILDAVDRFSAGTLAGYGMATIAAVLLGRLVWLFTTPYLIRALDRRPEQRARRVGPRPRLVNTWAGMRGAVSLAAALSLPFDFPDRDLLIFLAYCVVAWTVVVQGLTLPAVIRALDVVEDDDTDEREENAARIAAAEAALARLEELVEEDWVREDTADRLRRAYTFRRGRFKVLSGTKPDDDGLADRSLDYQRLLHELVNAQRAAVVALRDDRSISAAVMRRVERDLDLE
jgi:CPA1 family monovalent cation:H+ antiporter